MKKIENLYLQYCSEKLPYRKDTILKEAFDCYDIWAGQLSYKYSKCFPSRREEDWKQLVWIGVWQGLEMSNKVQDVRSNIYYRVLHNIRKEIQLIVAAKSPLVHEAVVEEFFFPRSNGTEEEITWVTKLDIEQALLKLPKKTRMILEFWMQGYPVLEICSLVGLKDAAVYNKINTGLSQLRTHLSSYEGEILNERQSYLSIY